MNRRLRVHLDRGAQHQVDTHAIAIQPDSEDCARRRPERFRKLRIRYRDSASSIPTPAPGSLLLLFVLLSVTGWMVLGRR
jgi:hypothetical protein